MPKIRRYPFLRHLRGDGNTYVRHLVRGKVVHEGVGLAFWFRPPRAVLSEVPIDDRELPLLFHARTSDFQDVTVQATVTYRIGAPATAADRLNFGVDPDTGRWHATPIEQLTGQITETAQQHAYDVLIATPLETALVEGAPRIRAAVEQGLAADPRLVATGVTVVGVRVVAVRPDPDLEKALQTPARERMQQEADRATYERRALAVDRERAISENELANQIELARREEQLVTQRGNNDRRRAEEAAAAGRITADAEASRAITEARARAESAQVVGAAEAEAERARLAAYADTEPATLLALAARELAGQLPEIGSITLTPDTVTGLLARLAGPDR